MKKRSDIFSFIIMIILSAVFLFPIAVVFMNSFKTKFSIMGSPFKLPNSTTFAGFDNYITGISSAGMGGAFVRSLFITVFSVAILVLLCSMTAWYIIRDTSRISGIIYKLFLFSMIVPFQMVMYTMTYVASALHLNNPVGIIAIYLGFGSGLSVFMLAGFVKAYRGSLRRLRKLTAAHHYRHFFK